MNIFTSSNLGFDLNLAFRRVKALDVQRLSMSELLNPGPNYLGISKGIQPNSLEIVTLETPSIIGPEEILVVPLYAGICGTDISIYTNQKQAQPGIIGHEVVAKVIKKGDKVSELKIGDLIAINPNNPLDPKDTIGYNGEGVFRRVFKIPKDVLKSSEKRIFALSSGLPLNRAIFVEPLSTVVRSQEPVLEEIKDRTVAVVGAGPIGMLQVMLAKLHGAKDVFLVNRSQPRLDLAIEKGIVSPDKTFLANEELAKNILKRTDTKGIDVVIIDSSFSAVLSVLEYVQIRGLFSYTEGFVPGTNLI